MTPASSPKVRTPRRALVLRSAACAAALVVGLTACSGDGDDEADASDSAETTTAGTADGAFPVTVEHALGTAEIEAEPVRVVALSEADEDAALALGVEPVGVIDTLEDGPLPWTGEARSGEEPTILVRGDVGVNLEQVAALEPDVILGGFAYFIDDQYGELSQIAPTTAYEGEAASTDTWQTTVRQVGAALGQAERADELVAEVEGVIADTAAEFPELDGTEFAFVSVWDAAEMGVLRSEEDSGVKLMTELGMSLDSDITALDSDEFAVTVGLEQLDLIDSDVLLANYADESVEAAYADQPLFTNLDVVARGSAVTLTLEEFWGVRNPTVLSLPSVLETIAPRAAEAAVAAG